MENRDTRDALRANARQLLRSPAVGSVFDAIREDLVTEIEARGGTDYEADLEACRYLRILSDLHRRIRVLGEEPYDADQTNE